MRKIACAILMLAAVCLPCGYAKGRPPKTETVDGYTYFYCDAIPGVADIRKVTDNWKYECAISPKPSGNLIIPSTLGGRIVRRIGPSAFQDCTELTSVAIPADVRIIFDQAFAGCSRLTSVTMSPRLITIRADAFSGCKSLRNITIPESVMEIGANAFLGTAVWDNHPDGVVYIDGWVCGYKGDKPTGELVLRSGTREIAESAFRGQDDLTSVVIPEGVKVIGMYAFLDCKNLTGVTIPPSVREIGDWAFAKCNGLTSVVIPEGVTTIGDSVFYECRNLRHVTIPESVTSIGRHIFSETPIGDNVSIDGVVYHGGWAHRHNGRLGESLVIQDGIRGVANQAFEQVAITNVVIPEGVKIIGKGAFARARGLESVTIPSSVASIGEDAFRECENLKELTIQPGVTSIGFYAFFKCTSLTDVVIPEGVTSIKGGTFDECVNLKSVTIPSSVTSIGGAFYACSNLTSVVIPEGVTSIGARAFSRCHRLASITLPSSLTNIADGAFATTSITSITIPSSVTHTGRGIFYNNALLREALFLGDAPTADDIYWGASEVLTTYVLPSSTGWDGDFNSALLPEKWEGRNIMHVSSDPLVVAKAALDVATADFHAWLKKFFPDSKDDYETLAGRRGANGLTLWDSYVAGLDPADPESRFRAFITIEDGSPIITWEPRLRNRVYTVVGKESLTDTADWGRTNSLTRFFKVRVELPTK